MNGDLAPAVLVGNYDLTPRQVEVLGQALADALAYRKARTGDYCAACEREYGGLCYDHANDELAADAYLALARELGVSQ